MLRRNHKVEGYRLIGSYFAHIIGAAHRFQLDGLLGGSDANRLSDRGRNTLVKVQIPETDGDDRSGGNRPAREEIRRLSDATSRPNPVCNLCLLAYVVRALDT